MFKEYLILVTSEIKVELMIATLKCWELKNIPKKYHKVHLLDYKIKDW